MVVTDEICNAVHQCRIVKIIRDILHNSAAQDCIVDIVCNEVTNATGGGGLTRAGSGTAAAPYTLGIADGGITSLHIANGTIKAEDLNSMGATSGQSLVYTSGAWAPTTKWATPVTIVDSYTGTGSITTGDYKDIYTFIDLEPGLYCLRVRMNALATAKFILQSNVAFGISKQFEANSTSNTHGGDGTDEIMFHIIYKTTIRLKSYCTGGCPARLANLRLSRF
ncbi:hypothetical protein AGMMS4957_15880 [Bacteroidia bacterium]|nr:hypothetical protein AGMMS4957_15880 [Bacteroidia bacterium]